MKACDELPVGDERFTCFAELDQTLMEDVIPWVPLTFTKDVFVIADSNHGYTMIAVGREVARVVLGEHSSLLHPFRYERFATGDLHPVSNSPYPWS